MPFHLSKTFLAASCTVRFSCLVGIVPIEAEAFDVFHDPVKLSSWNTRSMKHEKETSKMFLRMKRSVYVQCLRQSWFPTMLQKNTDDGFSVCFIVFPIFLRTHCRSWSTPALRTVDNPISRRCPRCNQRQPNREPLHRLLELSVLRRL